MMSGDLEMPTVSCLRCGAVYPEGAVVCFRCGAPIGDTSIPTQPVRRSQALPPPASLPFGQFGQMDGADGFAHVAPPPRVEQDRVPTRPRLPAVSSAVLPQRRPPTPIERWERRGRAGFTIFLALLIVAAIAGAAMGVHALLAGPPVAHQTVYQDPQHRFRFNRPVLWTATPSADGVLLSDSAGTSTLRVTVANPAAGETAESRADAIANAENLGISAPQSFAGTAWQVAVGDVTGRDGVVREVDIYVAEHAGQLYIIELSSPIASFDGIDNLVYEPLLSSFQFA